MAQQSYRGNLSARAFPFLSQNWGQTVIVPHIDNTFSRQLASAEDQDKDVGLAQMYYCHNVMPQQQGFQSVGYDIQINMPIGVTAAQTIYVQDDKGNANYLMWDISGNVYRQNGANWVLIGAFPVGYVTFAYVSGITYLYIAHVGCYLYNFATLALNSVTLIGLDVTSIIGITGAVGYLVVWNSPTNPFIFTGTTAIGSAQITAIPTTTGLYGGRTITGTGIPANATISSVDSGTQITISVPATANGVQSLTQGGAPSGVAWSSTINPLDFVPSLITGAGGGSVQQAKGPIIGCVAQVQGFFVYTASNIVTALYSGNARFPFNFKEIVNSGGVTDLSKVTGGDSAATHYVYTTSGLQIISSSQTQTTLPEVTDFISGKVFEDYNETTDTFSTTIISYPMRYAVSQVADRYLIISYGVSEIPYFTHAIVYDLTSKRWGKLKIPHIQVIEFQFLNPVLVSIPKQSIGFLQLDGTVKTVNFSVNNPTGDGVIMLGKYQYIRDRLMQLDQIDFENIQVGADFLFYILTALDGKNTVRVNPYLSSAIGFLREYFARTVGINHSLVIRGAFSLVSFELKFNIHGKR